MDSEHPGMPADLSDLPVIKKPPRKRPKPRKPAKKVVKSKPKAKKKAVRTSGPLRSVRLDLRLTRAEKVQVAAKAKKARTTITALVLETLKIR